MVTKHGVRAADVRALEDLPNVGPAIAAALRRIGLSTPNSLRGRDPYALYDELCRATRSRQDPCVLDTFIAAVRFMEGAPARPWWRYTDERKRELARRNAGPVAPRRRVRSAKPSPSAGEARLSVSMADLPNVGPVSRAMLAAAGIRSLGALRKLGAVEAYRRIRAQDPRASLNLLWALHGALTGRHWQEVARGDRLALLLQLEDKCAASAGRR